MPFELFVAFRYLWGKRRSFLVLLITLLSILGVAAGVAILNATLAVMTGFEQDLKDKILGMNSDAVVLKFGGGIEDWEPVVEEIRASDEVVGATPFTYNEVMLRSEHGVTGAVLKGADPVTIAEVTDLVSNICLPTDGPNHCGRADGQAEDGTEGRNREQRRILNRITAEHPVDGKDKKLPGVLLGRELADSLVVLPGDVIRVLSFTGMVGPGGMYPKVKSFKVIGTFKTGMWEYDTKFAFTSIPVAQSITNTEGKINGIEVKFTDTYDAPRIADELERSLSYPYTVKDWRELNGALFGALKMEKRVMGLLLSWVILLSGLCIVCILTIVVLEKRDEIAVLKTLGAGNGMILGIFALQGTFIGVIGTIFGTGIGYGIAKALQIIEWPLDTQVYYLDSVPVVLNFWNFVVVAVVAVGVSIGSSLLPSFVGAQQDPVEGLRHE